MNPFQEANNIELKVYELLQKVIDPELNINIIDLGLVYEITYSQEEGIHVVMTLTSEDCPLGEVVFDSVRQAIAAAYPDTNVNVTLTWEPPWTTERITDEGRRMLEE